MQHWRIGFLVFLILFPGCGRKQRTIFLFPKEKVVRLTTLQFPSPKIISLTQTPQGTLIEWLEPVYSPSLQQAHIQLLGYNIYRLTSHGFIPKKPLNPQPLTTTQYHDIQSTDQAKSYVVRALFQVHHLDHEGPTSNIGSTQ